MYRYLYSSHTRSSARNSIAFCRLAGRQAGWQPASWLTAANNHTNYIYLSSVTSNVYGPWPHTHTHTRRGRVCVPHAALLSLSLSHGLSPSHNSASPCNNCPSNSLNCSPVGPLPLSLSHYVGIFVVVVVVSWLPAAQLMLSDFISAIPESLRLCPSPVLPLCP